VQHTRRAGSEKFLLIADLGEIPALDVSKNHRQFTDSQSKAISKK
jgi:hypothetical protein